MARKQEQEPAQEEVTEVAPGVLRMQLPIRMPGLGHVNSYALVDARGAAVLDPGLPGPGSWRALRDRLQRAGLAPRHVHTVVVTHSHPDHFGGAARLAREAGAEVVAHADFRFGALTSRDEPEASVEDLAEASPPRTHRPDLEALRSGSARTPWGGTHPRPGWKTRLKWRAARWLGRSFLPTVTRPVKDGDVLRLGGREWVCVHTPGHTEDHVALHDPDTGLFLAGDHVLPTITPHISGLSREPDPLLAFFHSLERVAELSPVSQCLPAHGHPFEDLRGRAQAIRRHHEERLERVQAIGRELGPASVRAFSRKLFKPRSWGDMAESETYAHLEHLRLAGEAAARRTRRGRDGDGELVYETG